MLPIQHEARCLEVHPISKIHAGLNSRFHFDFALQMKKKSLDSYLRRVVLGSR